MGFGFNLIGFSLLILATLGLLTYFFISKRKGALKIVGVIWGFTILIIATAVIGNHFRTPIPLTNFDIIGNYCIDTNFFAGTNAKWQYKQYRFMITPTDSIYFYVINKDNIIKMFKEKIRYSIGPPTLWTVQMDTPFYQIMKYSPTLYRGHNRFYYIFKSDIYGNMFFRKVKVK